MSFDSNIWLINMVASFVFAGFSSTISVFYYFLFSAFGIVSFVVYLKIIREEWEDEKNE